LEAGMKKLSALREYKTSPVVASVTNTPQVPLSGPAADSAASARCRKRSTSARAGGIPFAAEEREPGDWEGRDCAAVFAAPARTTMPKTTHPTTSARNLRFCAIEPLPWGIRKEKSIIVHTVAGTRNEYESPIRACVFPLPGSFGWRPRAALHEDAGGHMIAAASSPVFTKLHFKEE